MEYRALVALLFLFAAGCAVSSRVVPVREAGVLEPVRTLALDSPAVAICADGNRLAVLEASGARILVLDSTLAAVDTIPLSTRVTAPRGLAADRFYYYVYDDQLLYRMLKDELVLGPWLFRVRVKGLAGFSVGEMLVSDDERNVVWYKTLFGESREFLGRVTVQDPGPIAALPDGSFCLLDGGERLVYFNRAGIVTKSIRLAGRYDDMVSDQAGVLYLGGAGPGRLLVVADVGRSVFELGNQNQVSIAAVAGYIALLDSGARIALYVVSSQ